MNLALNAYLDSMSEHEKNSYAKHMISFPSWRFKEVKNLDPDLWKLAQEIAKKSPREERR